MAAARSRQGRRAAWSAAWGITRRAGAVTCLVAVVAAAGCAHLIGARALDTARPGETTFHTLRIDGRERSFLLHLPPQASATHRVPLLLAFHGYTGNANVEMETTGLNDVADSAGFAVAYPIGTGRLGYAGLTWNAATCCGSAERLRIDDVAFSHALVQAVTRATPVDSTRVYATGFSAGGMMALLLACERQPMIVGAADVAGAMPDTTCAAPTKMPILLVRGDQDDELRHDHWVHRHRNNHSYAVSFNGNRQFWATRNGCSAHVRRDSTPTYVLISQLGCPPGLDVRELIVQGQAHAWPGGGRPWPFSPKPAPGVDASTMIARFFAEERVAAASVSAGHAANAP
jgi:polyhydroxybutyrate depolymerase